MMNTVRAFIAIEMPRSVIDVVRQSQQALQRGGVHLRWVRPENVHLTLRFLGDISTGAIVGIRSVLERVAAESPLFSLHVKGAGAFPGAARPRVVWLGLEGEIHHLEGLVRNLSMMLAQQGFPIDKRPFRGHLTIGRVKDRIDSDRLRYQMTQLADVETEPFPAGRLCLFKSVLTPGGAVYTPLVQIRIGGGNE